MQHRLLATENRNHETFNINSHDLKRFYFLFISAFRRQVEEGAEINIKNHQWKWKPR